MNTQRRSRARAGFTLIEVMVVVVIIGMLAGMLVFNFMRQAEEARVETTKTMIKTVGQQLDLFKLKFGKYPSALQELVPNYTDRVPQDGWNREFLYQRDTQTPKGYRLWSQGADGAPGGDGFDADLSNLDDLK
jgi:general secretion pathway protein G